MWLLYHTGISSGQRGESIRVEELPLSLVDCGIEWTNWCKTGEVAPVIWVVTSWWAEM